MKPKHILHEALERVERRRSLPCPAERRLLRLRAGLTLADVAESIGTTAPSVSRYETGRRSPRGLILDKYLEAIKALTHAKPTT